MINVFIKGQALKVVAPVVVSDSIKYLEARFHFQTSDWNGLSKWAHFSKGETVYDIHLTDDAILKSDNLNLSDGVWSIYIHGTGEDGSRITTDSDEIVIKKSGAIDGQPFPDVPLTAIEELDRRISALEKGGGGGSGGSYPGVYFGEGEMPEGYELQIRKTDDDFRILQHEFTTEKDVVEILAEQKNTVGTVQNGKIVPDLEAGTYELRYEDIDGSEFSLGEKVVN